MRTKRVLLLRAITAALQTVNAQAGWRDKPVRMVVPFLPGGNADVAALSWE